MQRRIFRPSLWTVFAVALVAAGCPTPKSEPLPVVATKALGDTTFVNCGGPAFVDSSGNSWLADTNFNTGNTFSTNNAVAGAPDGQPYQSERWDSNTGQELMYSIPFAPGEYTVRLHFAEIYSGAADVGDRVFDVLIEGQVVLDNYDIVADAGYLTAVVKEFPVNLVDGTLNIQFLHVTENPKISGIEIIEGPVTFPELDASPASLDLGSVQVGNVSAGQTVTLTNIGTDVLNVSNIAVQGSNALDFTTDAAPSYAIDPGLTANFDVTFGPTGAGARSAELVITSDDANSPTTIPLSGTGLAPVANVSPLSTDFGSVFTGDTSTVTTVTITNDGNQTLNVSSISLGGANPGDFGTTAAASYTIAPAGSETFDVTFSPTTGGARSAELSIVSDDPASPATVSLSGTGVVPQPPTADVSPVAMDFGTMTVDNTSSPQSVMITNVGDQTLDVTGVSASGDFGTDAAPPYSIAPSSSVSFNVTFTPTQEGARAGQVDITSNDPASPATVLLSGQGQQSQPPTAALNPVAHDFGTVTTSESGTPLLVTLSNIGDETLEVSSVGIGGANAGDFGTDALAPYAIDPGNAVNFNVTFTPAASGARSASLSVVSNDPNTPAVLSLSGTGQDPLPPNAAVSPLSFSFGSVTLPDSSSPQLVTITNDGEETLNVTNVSFSGTNPGDFGSDALASYAIEPTESASFNVTFTPTAGGARTANLDIDSNDPDGSVLVPLDGTGVEPPKASVTPTPHDFGQEFFGNTTAPQTFTVENIDTEAHDLTGISLTGANPGDFDLSATPALPLTMNASDTATADVAFAPTDVGGRPAQLVFEFDSGAFSVAADLSGTGADSIPVAFYRVNAGGDTYVDGNGDTWEDDDNYVNTGNNFSAGEAIAGTIEDTLYQSERWDGSGGAEMMYTFPVDPGEYTVRLHFAEIFSGNASVGARVFNVNVEGSPFLTNFDIFAAAGFATATTRETTVQVNDGNLNVEFIHVTENPKISAIEILGNVTGVPVLSATPTSVDFGQVEIGAESAPTTVTLNNVGNVELQVSGVQITNAVGGTFNHNALPSYNIAPAGSAAFDVTFTPGAQGAQSATLEIASNDGASPAMIPLAGEGAAPAPDVSIAPSNVAFGSADIGSSTASTTVTITNDGGTSHTLESISVGGANSSDFLLSALPGMPMTLNPGDSASADVAFAPSATGARAGQLIFSLDAGAITPTASLSGTGQSPPPPPPSGLVVHRINVGGSAYVDTLGNTWSGDQFFNTGSSFSVTDPIAGTEDDPLYQTERWDNANAPELMYSLPVDNGTYDVRLHFAEIFDGITTAGQRVFSINVEGQPAVTNYDIFGAVGYLTADVLTIPATVNDGTLNIELIHVTENPKISAIEVAVAGGLESDVAIMEWGHVGVGATGDVKNVTLTNTGDVDATIASLSFNITAGVGHDFHATLGGSSYAGEHADITYPVNVVVPVGESVVVPVQFLPTEEADNDVNLVFAGNFGSVPVRLVGTGGEEGGHPFLHVVIVTDPYVVDFDGNGTEPIELIGQFSHTHEIGHDLTAFEWTENGGLFATTPDVTTPFAVGDHTVTLTIFDDNVPAETLAGSETFSVVSPDQIPGVLAQYFTAGGLGGANAYLDAVPANADFAETVSDYQVLEQGGLIGGSPFSTFVMVQLLGRIDIDTAGDYLFMANGGDETRLFLDGSLHTAAESLAPGLYDVEARFAVNGVGDLPLTVTYGIDGGAQMPIDPLVIVHDEASMKPVINSMPSSGLEIGGAVIDIDGLGFFPADQVTVHWGATDLSGPDLTVTPTQITLTTPPGINSVQVTVETPNGVSNPKTYTYSSTGPAPVQFTFRDVVTGLTDPTAAAIGADGRLYVSELDGTIFAYTFDEDYNPVDTQTITTFESLSNFHILGLETNPFDPPGVVRIYVAHNQLFPQGGACFTGFMPYSGQISYITGPDFDTVVPIAENLPVSNHDHGVSGMAFDDNGYLYATSPGVTNAGIIGCNMGGIDASPLTGAIIRLNLPLPDYNGVVVYRDPYTCIENDDAVFGQSVIVDYGVDIDVYAPGIRNSFDVEYTTKGRLYATDNGPNDGFGPASTGPDTQDPDPTVHDEIVLVDVGRYYGHPNRNIQRAPEDPRQYIFRPRDEPTIPGEYEGVVANVQASTNGIIEYRAQTFNDAVRGDLFAQRWNATTYRTTLSADGKSATNHYNIFSEMTGLNVIGAPGGVIFGIDFSSGLVSIAEPNDITAVGLTMYDIYPWRAPATGGHEFIIGGENFGNIGNTSVTIGGKSATVTEVSSRRIKGIIPSSSVGAGPDMLDVVVTVGTNSVAMPDAFRYLRAPGEDSGSRARMFVDPGGSMNESSTYGFGSFNLTNDSTNGQKITRMRIDIENAIMPDSVFDPYGLAGDPVGKDFTHDNGNVGVTGFTWFSPNGGGFNALEVTFDDFNAGETLRFSTDIDPTSVNGAAQPGPNHSASISGFDLTGAHFRVEFDDGTALEGTLFRTPGSDTGAEGTALAASIAPPEAEIEALGQCGLSTTTNANQTIEVRGPAGYDVRLLVVESALYLEGVPGGGFDIDPFEYNTSLSIVEQTATIGGGGTVQIPVTLTKSDPDGGYNAIIAVLVDAQGNEGPVSDTLVLQLL